MTGALAHSLWMEYYMKWPSFFKLKDRNKAALNTSRMGCPRCGNELRLEDKDTSSGRDMRTYRCDSCQESQIVDFGMATWKAMSDSRESDS